MVTYYYYIFYVVFLFCMFVLCTLRLTKFLTKEFYYCYYYYYYYSGSYTALHGTTSFYFVGRGFLAGCQR